MDKTISMNDISSFITAISSLLAAVSVVIGGVFTWLQWRKTTALKRADYIKELTMKWQSDQEIKKITYLIDYSERWYSADFHCGGDLEKEVDATLSYFSYICYLNEKKIISKDEFRFLEYKVARILQSSDVQNYFYNIYHFAKKFGKEMSFYYLFVYGEKNNFFDKEFYNVNSKVYPHCLNF
ncbi:MAG: hypothetical protein R3Y06_00670 [Faecalibacterium sp.]